MKDLLKFLEKGYALGNDDKIQNNTSNDCTIELGFWASYCPDENDWKAKKQSTENVGNSEL